MQSASLQEIVNRPLQSVSIQSGVAIGPDQKPEGAYDRGAVSLQKLPQGKVIGQDEHMKSARACHCEDLSVSRLNPREARNE